MSGIANTPAWQALSTLAARSRTLHLRQMFAADPSRFERFSLEHDGLLLDFSKQRVTTEVMTALHTLWDAAEVSGWTARMRAGEAINNSEGRAVLHVALRENQPRAEVRAVLDKMRRFCADIHGGVWRGSSGEAISDVVNIGIGGSDLGPRMAAQALAAHHLPNLRVHFVSNLDAAHLATTLAGLVPQETLFIVASKTFTTQETMTNARSAREWIIAALGESAVARHFVAVSTNLPAVAKFGIDPGKVFEFWDWVGGRFSVWSAIGLPLALAIGYANFERLLAGGQAMDEHFFTAPPARNLPATLALLGIWNTDFLGAETLAVLPYSQSLEQFPRYLQQLEMESNGKQIGRDGLPVGAATSPIVWGEPGTNGQHAFYQLIHQGGRLIPCEFIALKRADFDLPGHHAALLANCFAQSEALMRGKTAEEVRGELESAGMPADALARLAPFKVFPGNQPSSTLLLSRLDPYALGQLIALYEHKTFVQGIVWGLNSFDQWGVELGKQLAARLLPLLEGKQEAAALDSSTHGLIAACRATQKDS
ncbi:MAG: glucose-6-phosphate isomerase [Rhodocyclaceae bacterium]|nr:MAG: glucose-6-phosphate isomerase [Rhodocyclaceae bacterium]